MAIPGFIFFNSILADTLSRLSRYYLLGSVSHYVRLCDTEVNADDRLHSVAYLSDKQLRKEHYRKHGSDFMGSLRQGDCVGSTV